MRSAAQRRHAPHAERSEALDPLEPGSAAGLVCRCRHGAREGSGARLNLWDVKGQRAVLLAEFAASVRALREEAGRPSIRSLSEASALSEGSVCDALAGRRRPSRRAVVAIAVALGGDPQVWGSRWDELDAVWRVVPGARWRRAPGDDPHRCQVEGCVNQARGRLCSTHRLHKRLHGEPTAGTFNIMTHPKVCGVEGCERPYHAKGMCRSHYVRVGRASRASRDL